MKKTTLEKEKLTLEKTKELMDRLLEATNILARSHPKVDKKYHYIRVLEGFYCRSTFTFLGIRYLSNQPSLSDSAGVLARKMIEDVIAIEYILLEGKEKMAKRFQDFLYVQAYQEIEQRKKLGYEIPPEKEMTKLLKRLEKLKLQFWHKPSNQFMRSWSGKDFEKMLIDIARAKLFAKHEIHSILLGYTYGSWKSHPNPTDVLSYMTNKSRIAVSDIALKQSTILAIMSFIRLITRYIDEIREIKQKNLYEDINKVVKEVFSYLDDESLKVSEDF